MTPWKAKVPNFLTISRIILIPVLVFGIIGLKNGLAANIHLTSKVMSLFILLSLTDFLDGYLARRWNVTSDFGRMIDPIADKLMVAASLIAIAVATQNNSFILIPMLAIIGRDIFVSGIREHAALQSRVIPPTKLAKWKTACEMLAISLFILYLGLPFFPGYLYIELGAIALLWLAATLSVYTGYLYLKAALRNA